MDTTMRLPFRQTPPKIAFQPGRGLVALFSIFGQELHGESRKRLGDCGAIMGWRRLSRDVAVDPLQRVGGFKRQRSGKHLVQGDAQRVEIASRTNRAIHAAGLFGRHVGEGTGDDLRRCGGLTLLRKLRSDPEAGEPYIPSVVDQHVLRFDVLMYKTALVDLAERRSQADRDAQNARQIQRRPTPHLVPLKNPIQELAAGILEDQYGSPLVASKCQRHGRPPGIKFGCQRIFALQAPQPLGRRRIWGERYQQERRWVAVLAAAIQRKIGAFPERLQHVSGRLGQGGLHASFSQEARPSSKMNSRALSFVTVTYTSRQQVAFSPGSQPCIWAARPACYRSAPLHTAVVHVRFDEIGPRSLVQLRRVGVLISLAPEAWLRLGL